MKAESIRFIAARLESYFDWYFRTDPEATPRAWTLVNRFFRLVRGPGDAAEARRLFEDTGTLSFGSQWEEMRAVLQTLSAR